MLTPRSSVRSHPEILEGLCLLSTCSDLANFVILKYKSDFSDHLISPVARHLLERICHYLISAGFLKNAHQLACGHRLSRGPTVPPDGLILPDIFEQCSNFSFPFICESNFHVFLSGAVPATSCCIHLQHTGP